MAEYVELERSIFAELIEVIVLPASVGYSGWDTGRIYVLICRAITGIVVCVMVYRVATQASELLFS